MSRGATTAGRLAGYRPGLRVREQGTVISVGDGIAWVDGLPSAGMDDVLRFEDGSRGLVFELTEGRLGAILLEETDRLEAGTRAMPLRGGLAIGAGDALLGRVVDPLGRPLDGDPPPQTRARRPLEAPSPPITARAFVDRPLYTGTRIIDTLVPVGRGQRQLLIGDEGTGRSAIAMDAVINQRDQGVLCVYCLIGQKRSTTLSTVETLRQNGALAHTVVLVAEAVSLPGMKYLAPFAACALAEEWMYRGHDTLVVYDDLSTHARAYRELSLLLRRPPGREAYPGDIFYLHARLLERSTALAPSEGGGSMTTLPVVETQQGEIAAYIPTNLISITDGQVYLDRDLFAGGFRPAIDVARSVSRIGGQAQHPAVRAAAAHLRLDYLQFLEMEVFTRFGARLEASMERRLERGRLLRELLKQDRLAPVPVVFDLAWMIAYQAGLLDDLGPEQAAARLNDLLLHVGASGLTLDSPRDAWLEALRGWLGGGR
ncbi:F0F1 ATP synthase subunit alpha [Arhodomonas aquaeolei]|uniref:F0F1 ATP synthase subunit alpha n=1 Tax=Arhodomonas TaxID=2368 RepID=UPI0013D6B44D|nr:MULTISPECIES: F0F1 ATP synthase subunit alpha [Arhodomonas]MCS4503340.1 F0F1 ATP synthase subunit alpha [Arhodomonas aquaeolei]